jgi:tetratricopeptide (TPR) repeat protein
LQWWQCQTCKQDFSGDMQLGLAEAHWETVRALPAEDRARRFAMTLLATALHSCSHNYEAALPLLEECLALNRRVDGDEHRNTLTAIGNLAELHRAMGHLEQALALGTEALAGKRCTLGSEHPSTLDSIDNLACVHQSAENYDLALPLFEEALDARRRTLGDQHAETLTCFHNLAVVRGEMGELAEAMMLLREAVAGFRRVLGGEHPETRQAVRNLRATSEALEARKPERSALGVGRRLYESRPQARVVGIQSRPELNGRLVRVGELVEATGRFCVLVLASEVPAAGGQAIFARRCIYHSRFFVQKQTWGVEMTALPARWLARGDCRGHSKFEAGEPSPRRRRAGLPAGGGEVHCRTVSRLTEFYLL